MSDATLKYLAEGTCRLAEHDPIAACKALLAGLRLQSEGGRQIAVVGGGGPAISQSRIAGPAYSNPASLAARRSPAAVSRALVGSDDAAAGQPHSHRRR